MLSPKPPKDSIASIIGLCAAAMLAVGLAYAFWGPATRIAATHWQEVWVTLVKPGPPVPVHAGKPNAEPQHGAGHV
jgi:hypothetical protein